MKKGITKREAIDKNRQLRGRVRDLEKTTDASGSRIKGLEGEVRSLQIANKKLRKGEKP